MGSFNKLTYFLNSFAIKEFHSMCLNPVTICSWLSVNPISQSFHMNSKMRCWPRSGLHIGHKVWESEWTQNSHSLWVYSTTVWRERWEDEEECRFSSQLFLL